MFEDGAVTNKASHIQTYIDGSIERLGFKPDLYYLHRMDCGKDAKFLFLVIGINMSAQTHHSRNP